MIHFKRSVFQGVLLIGTLFLGGKASLTPLWAMEGEKEMALASLDKPAQEYYPGYYEKIAPKKHLPKTFIGAIRWSPSKLPPKIIDNGHVSKKEYLRAHDWHHRNTKGYHLPSVALAFGKEIDNWKNKINNFKNNQETARNLRESLSPSKQLERERISEQINLLFPSWKSHAPKQQRALEEDGKIIEALNQVLPPLIERETEINNQLDDFYQSYTISLGKTYIENYNKDINEAEKKGTSIQNSMSKGFFFVGVPTAVISFILIESFLEKKLSAKADQMFPFRPGDLIGLIAKPIFYGVGRLGSVIASASLGCTIGFTGGISGSWIGYKVATIRNQS